MQKLSIKIFLLVPMAAALAVSSGPAWAKNGWYMGMDLGVAMAPSMDMDGTDNDYDTPCDKHVNPTGFQTTELPGGKTEPKDCTAIPSPTAWFHDFDGGAGLLAGAALGYRLGGFRVEGEYFYRGTTYDSTDPDTIISDPETTRKALEELDIIEGRVDDVLSNNFFVNLYYDYHSDWKFTPYVGFGVGFAQVSLDYFGRFTRNSDPADIRTFNRGVGSSTDQATAENLNRRLAGTTTIGSAKLSDTLFGYQVIAGVDYPVSEPVTIGLKFRWASFSEFEDGKEWDQLRSHESTNKRPGDPVRYKMSTDDIQFWSVSLNMKYQF